MFNTIRTTAQHLTVGDVVSMRLYEVKGVVLSVTPNEYGSTSFSLRLINNPHHDEPVHALVSDKYPVKIHKK